MSILGDIIGGASSIIGGGLSAGASAYGQRQQIAWERERAQNAHQWEVQDLKKAGLNPILSAGGSGAVTGGINGIDGSGISSGINSALNYIIQKQQIKNENTRISNETKATNANVLKTNAERKQIEKLTPELVKSQQFNRHTTVGKYIKEFYDALTSAVKNKNVDDYYSTLKNYGLTPDNPNNLPFYPTELKRRTQKR